MIFRPPIKHKNIVEKSLNIPKRELVKDKERIDKIKSLCEHLGLFVQEIESPSELITYLIIKVKYKESKNEND